MSTPNADARPSNSEIRPISLRPACLCLRHKLMYVDERQASPGMVDDSSDTRVYFCTKSQDSLGPDAKPVHPHDCAAGRSCFKGA